MVLTTGTKSVGGGGGIPQVKNHSLCSTYAGSTQVTSGSCTFTVNAIGDSEIIAVAGCNGPSCGGGSMPTITSLSYTGGTCADVAGTQVASTSAPGTDIWFCQNMQATGAVVFSFTAAGGGGTGGLEYATLFGADYSGIAPSGAAELGNQTTGVTTANTVFTLGLGSGGTSPTSLANELVFAICTAFSSAGITVTAQQTVLDNTTSGAAAIAYLDEYTTVTTPGPSPMGCTPNDGGNDYAISVAAFKPGSAPLFVAYEPPITITGW